MKVGYDFDGCLGDIPAIQLSAMAYLKAGVEVFILTYRDDFHANKDVWELATQFGIPRENVYICGHRDKKTLIRELDLDLYYDDDALTVNNVNLDRGHKCLALVLNYCYGFENILD